MLDNLIQKINRADKNFNTERIIAAYEVADSAHAGQMRKSGEPYISHPVAVAEILIEIYPDTDTIVAALLHDVIEDTKVTFDMLAVQFGEDVAKLVDGVTKIGLVPLNATKEEQKAENIRKILMAMSRDLRVIFIKLADRLHNMRTLGATNSEQQKRVSTETLSFYAPIAHRLGMAHIKEEMEDISLRFLDSYAYSEIEKYLLLHKEERDAFIEKIKDRITSRVSDMDPPPVIEGRIKGIYSIYSKAYINGKELDEVYDIYAVRIIVDSNADCYNVLGIVHDMFNPIPYRLKDYIATPKSNHYQSLHTTVIGKEGLPFEVQIRTHEMHHTARNGIAAHWRYKNKTGVNFTKDAEKRFTWIRNLLEQQQESDDVEHLADAIKVDLSPNTVYTFTPNGDVVTLADGSTPVDFAYTIHTQVGNKMVGAKVSGRMVSFDYKLKTGDIVEIKTTNSADYGPNRSWLNYAKTSDAKAKIRNWLKRERRDENIVEGREFIKAELKRNKITADKTAITKLAEKHKFATVNDFYAAIGYGGLQTAKVIMWLKKELTEKPDSDTEIEPDDYLAKFRKKAPSKGVIVDGIDNCLVKYAQCCNPLPGDDVVGFVTQGYGVSVHKTECANVKTKFVGFESDAEHESESGRWLKVSWAADSTELYSATLNIIAEERRALLADITSAIASHHISISGINARILKNGNASVSITTEVAGVEQLNNIIVKLKKIKGVISIERTGK